jgi:hypothetical protein
MGVPQGHYKKDRLMITEIVKEVIQWSENQDLDKLMKIGCVEYMEMMTKCDESNVVLVGRKPSDFVLELNAISVVINSTEISFPYLLIMLHVYFVNEEVGFYGLLLDFDGRAIDEHLVFEVPQYKTILSVEHLESDIQGELKDYRSSISTETEWNTEKIKDIPSKLEKWVEEHKLLERANKGCIKSMQELIREGEDKVMTGRSPDDFLMELNSFRLTCMKSSFPYPAPFYIRTTLDILFKNVKSGSYRLFTDLDSNNFDDDLVFF